MTELSPSARKLLDAALVSGYVCKGSGGLTGGVAVQVRKSLINACLIEKVPFEGRGDAFPDPEKGAVIYALRITDAGREAIGAAAAQKGLTQRDEGAPAAKPPAEAKARTPRENSKQSKLLEMLQRPEGATVAELTKAFDWKPHTTRAAISTLPKKADCPKPTSEKVEGRGRVYRVAAE